jgi:signal peptidase I
MSMKPDIEFDHRFEAVGTAREPGGVWTPQYRDPTLAPLPGLPLRDSSMAEDGPTPTDLAQDRRRNVQFAVGLLGQSWIVLWISMTLWTMAPVILLGWTSSVITSDSMAPGIRRGDVVIASPLEPSAITSGTVVVFEDTQERGLVTHRVIGINADGSYRTKGDANMFADSTPLTSDQVVGEGQVLIPLMGLPAIWLLQGPWQWSLLWAVSLLLALWVATAYRDPWAEPRSDPDEFG